jgi:hypothetical protein
MRIPPSVRDSDPDVIWMVKGPPITCVTGGCYLVLVGCMRGVCGCVYVCTYVYMYVCMYVCVCVCVCVCLYDMIHIHIYIHTYIYIYTYIHTYIYEHRCARVSSYPFKVN